MAGFKMLPWGHLQVPDQGMLFEALSSDLNGSCKWSGNVVPTSCKDKIMAETQHVALKR